MIQSHCRQAHDLEQKCFNVVLPTHVSMYCSWAWPMFSQPMFQCSSPSPCFNIFQLNLTDVLLIHVSMLEPVLYRTEPPYVSVQLTTMDRHVKIVGYPPNINYLMIWIIKKVTPYNGSKHPSSHKKLYMRNRDHHRENVENILAICLPIVTMQHIRESSSANHAMVESEWNGSSNKFVKGVLSSYNRYGEVSIVCFFPWTCKQVNIWKENQWGVHFSLHNTK